MSFQQRSKCCPIIQFPKKISEVRALLMSPSNSLVPLPPESAEHCFCLNLVDDEGDRKWNPKPFKPFAFPVRILNLVSPLLPWESSHPTAVFFAKDQRKKSRKETLRIVMAYRERPDFCVTGKESQHNAFSTQEVSPGNFLFFYFLEMLQSFGLRYRDGNFHMEIYGNLCGKNLLSDKHVGELFLLK